MDYSGLTPDDAGDSSSSAAEATSDTVLSTLADIRSQIDRLASTPLWPRSDAHSRDAVREGFATMACLEAAWLRLVADLDTRPGAVPKARTGYTAQTYL